MLTVDGHSFTLVNMTTTDPKEATVPVPTLIPAKFVYPGPHDGATHFAVCYAVTSQPASGYAVVQTIDETGRHLTGGAYDPPIVCWTGDVGSWAEACQTARRLTENARAEGDSASWFRPATLHGEAGEFVL